MRIPWWLSGKESTHKAGVCAKLFPSCPVPCNAMDCSPPVSSVHGNLKARILEWVAISFSRGSPGARNGTCITCISFSGRQALYLQHHLGSPSAMQETLVRSLDLPSLDRDHMGSMGSMGPRGHKKSNTLSDYHLATK